MTKGNKLKGFILIRVKEYYYPNGNKYDGTAIGWYTIQIIFMLTLWLLFPLWFVFSKDNPYRGTKKIYYRAIEKEIKRT